MKNNSSIFDVFKSCVHAIQKGKFIQRETRRDKEFHFQNWFSDRLKDTGSHYEVGGRNTFPDFRMVHFTEGYETKGLAYPGRELNYDSNSQVPTGRHNGRIIFYIFGRYPAEPDEDSFPVLDLVICHGDFLNADHDYIHENKNLKGFGSYGDILIRDRKMYVAPTPFGLVTGVAHIQTLILPGENKTIKGFKKVGEIIRKETDKLIVGYTFDLKGNTLTPESIPNPFAGREHIFHAWRLEDGSDQIVKLREVIATDTRENHDDSF